MTSIKANDPRIIIALDYSRQSDALSLISKLDPIRCRLKVGKEMFTRFGPALIDKLIKSDFQVFLDLKYHDIPNTVAKACDAACDLGVWMVNVHASGGRRMMEAARDAVEQHETQPLLIAVTILTSLAQEDIAEVGYQGTPEENVLRLAKLAESSGMDGVVCSPREVSTLRHAVSDQFRLVTPGIRPAGEGVDDQRRTMTPSQALRAGANYLVIGRPITGAADPMQALLTIESEISDKPGA